MPMSDICRRTAPPDRSRPTAADLPGNRAGGVGLRLNDREKGFTLIEMLVVMLVMSLLAGLVAPSINTSVRRYELRTQRQQIVTQFADIAYRAFVAGRPASLQAADLPGEWSLLGERVVLPAGWRMETSGDIRFAFNGVCTRGGTVTLIDPEGGREVYRFRPPKCRPETA